MRFQEVLKHCVLVAVMFGLAGSAMAQEAIPTMKTNLAESGALPRIDPYCGKYPSQADARPVITDDQVEVTIPGGYRWLFAGDPSFVT